MFRDFLYFFSSLSLFCEINSKHFLAKTEGRTYLVESKNNEGKDMEKIELKGDTLGGRSRWLSKHSDYDLGPKKNPPEKDPSPRCLKQPCQIKKIKTKFYVYDDFWNSFQRMGDERIKTLLDKTLDGMNKYLSQLDNGGYKVVVEDPLMKLSNSDVQLKDSYVDRLDMNKSKLFDKRKIEAYTFAFQEAVQELPNRNDVDLRILLVERRSSFSPDAQTEERCICNPTGFGCISVMSLRGASHWASPALFAHEVGHALGQDVHDDFFYKETNNSPYLLLWPHINRRAYIWSDETRKKINEQDHTCLQLDIKQNSADKVEERKKFEDDNQISKMTENLQKNQTYET